MLALNCLYVAFVTLGGLAVPLPVSPDQKALLECLYANFASSLL